ncbi:DUF4214 domain-containing protein, partial [Prochlorococcus marinus]
SANEGFDFAAYMAGSERRELLLAIDAVSRSTPDPTSETEKDSNGESITSVYLENPPATMPKIGSLAYALLEKEIGTEISGDFNYSAHIAATREPKDYPDWLNPVVDKDPNGGLIAPVYLENPPASMPKIGSLAYTLLEKEIGTEISEDFNYKAHIAATRRPKDYPDWLDPVIDIDDRWIESSKLNTSKTFEKKLEDYDFFKRSDGSIEIKTEDGFDDITGIPKLQFADKVVSAIAEIEATFDQVKAKDDVTGKMFRVYNAAFNRFPDSDGLEYWIEKNGSGENTERQVAESFLGSNEFKEKYGANISNEQYVKTLYQNILDREPDTDGYNYWVGQLNNGLEDRSELLLGFAESTENQALFTEITGFS